MKVMSMLRYFLPNGGDILLNFTHTMDFFAEWKAADSENNFYTIYSDFCTVIINLKCITTLNKQKVKELASLPLTEPQNKLLLVNQGIPKDILYQIKKTLLEDTNGTHISANLYKLSECPCCSLLWTVCGRLKIIHTMF